MEEKKWRGSPLDMGSGLDPYGIREVAIEFANGDEDVFRPRLRDEFASYEVYQMAVYLDTVAHEIRQGQKR